MRVSGSDTPIKLNQNGLVKTHTHTHGTVLSAAGYKCCFCNLSKITS